MKKNKKILEIFNTIKSISVIDPIEEINPNDYVTVEQFIRIYMCNNNRIYFSIHNAETIEYSINKNNYCVIAFPPSDKFNHDCKEIFKFANRLKKLEQSDQYIRGYVIDLRSNTGGDSLIFSLFGLIFIDPDYEGLLYTVKKETNENKEDILFDHTVVNNNLIMRRKYSQDVNSFNISKLYRVKNNKNIKILLDNYSASGSEFLSMMLKSFGAKLYGIHDKSAGALNITVSYLLNNGITLRFPNAYIYDRNNLQHNIYLETKKIVGRKYFAH